MPPTPTYAATLPVATARRLGTGFVRHYHRLAVSGDLASPSEPVLFVANHGFGTVFDLNVLATYAAFEELRLDRPVTALVHQLAWTLRMGPLVEPFGARPASHSEARAAFHRGEHVLVLPGGDLDAFKPYADRHRIVFGGRTGFARLSLAAGVPVVPVVTSGAGDTVRVLADGRRLARALRLDRTLRLKAVPVSLSLPWGLGVGAGFLPYLPLPARLRTEVLPAMRPYDGEPAEAFAARVEAAMQASLDGLSGGTGRPTHSRSAPPAGPGPAR